MPMEFGLGQAEEERIYAKICQLSLVLVHIGSVKLQQNFLIRLINGSRQGT